MIRRYKRRHSQFHPNKDGTKGNSEPVGRGDPVGLVIATVNNRGTHVRLGFSLCNPVDRWDYTEANRQAYERLRKGQFTFPISVVQKNSSIVKDYLNDNPHFKDIAVEAEWTVLAAIEQFEKRKNSHRKGTTANAGV